MFTPYIKEAFSGLTLSISDKPGKRVSCLSLSGQCSAEAMSDVL